MGKFFLFLPVLLLISCGEADKNAPPPVQKQTEKEQSFSEKIKILYKDARYFELRDALKSAQRVKRNSAWFFYQGAVKSLFNETDSSLILIDNYLRMSDTSESHFQLYAYQLQAVNYYNKDEPQKTYELIQKCISLFGDRVSKGDRNQLINLSNGFFFEAQSSVSYNKRGSPFELKLLDKDPERIAVSITLNGKQADFILDTGSDANLVTRKTAEEFGLKESNYTLYTNMIHGVKGGKAATATALTIGNLDVKNATFLIMNDEDFPLVDFKGIIGYNLMRHLEKVMIDFENMKLASSSKQLNPVNQNLCNTGQGLVINVKAPVNSLILLFDTGSFSTELKESKYTNENQFRFRTPNQRLVPELQLTVSNKNFHFKNVFMYDKDFTGIWHYWDGIFGTDALRQFKRVYIDFEKLLIEFE